MLLAERRLSRSVAALWRHRYHYRDVRGVQTQAQYEYPSSDDADDASARAIPAGLAAPRQVCDESAVHNIQKAHAEC